MNGQPSSPGGGCGPPGFLRGGLRSLLPALLFPLFYTLVRRLTQSVWVLCTRAAEAARESGLTPDMLNARVSAALAGWSPWILIVSALLTVALLAVLFARSRGGLPGFVGMGRMAPGSARRLAALAAGLNVGLTCLITVLPIPASWLDEHGSMEGSLSAAGWAVRLACVVLAAPLAEEVVFRGLSARFLRAGLPAAAALLGQALLFAAFHGVRLQMLYAFPAGLALGAVYLWQGTLRAPLLLHMAFNALSLVWAPPGPLWARLALLGAAAPVVALSLRALRRAGKAASLPGGFPARKGAGGRGPPPTGAGFRKNRFGPGRQNRPRP